MAVLGTIEIKLKEPTTVRRIAIYDEHDYKIASGVIVPTQVADGDRIQLDFEVKQ